MPETCEIQKRLILESYQLVKQWQNGGAAGIDGRTIEGFAERLKDNLYKLWNRMSSGSCHPKNRPARGDTQEKRRNKTAGDTYGNGQDRADGGEDDL